MRQNTRCEIFCSQWLSQLFDYSTQGVWGLGIRETLKSMLEDNKMILTNQVDKKMIEDYIDYLLKEGLDPKFAQILSKTCLCNDEPIYKNQRLVTEIMLRDANKRNRLILGVKDIHGEIYIKDPSCMLTKDAFILLRNFETGKVATYVNPYEIEDMDPEMQTTKNTPKKFNFKKAYEYFLSCLILMGDICTGRNTAAIHYLRKYYDFNTCSKIIKSDKYGFPLRRAMCYLIQRLWVDVDPFRESPYPTCTKFWSKFDDDHEGRVNWVGDQEVSNLAIYEDLKEFVYNYLIDICDSEEFNWGKGKEFVQVILDLCEKMLRLRFFYRIEAFKQIFKSLTKVLKITDKYKDQIKDKGTNLIFTIPDEGVTSGNSTDSRKGRLEANANLTEDDPEEWLVLPDFLKLKKKTMDILKLLVQIQTDLRASAFFANYKFAKLNRIMKSQGLVNPTSPAIKSSLLSQQSMNVHKSFVTKNSTIHSSDSNGGLRKSYDGGSKKNHEEANWYVENYEKFCEDRGLQCSDTLRETNVNFNYCLYNSPASFIEHSSKLFDLLVDQLKYKDESYKKLVTELMYGLYTSSTSLGETLIEIQMIEVDCQQIIFERISKAITELFQCAEGLEENFYYNPDKALSDITGKIQNLYNSISLKQENNKKIEL